MKTASRLAMNNIAVVLTLGMLVGALFTPAQAEPLAPSSQPATQPSTQPAAVSGLVNAEKEIKAYEQQDRKSPPPQGAVLFVGSSGIRLWKTLAQDFPDHVVINRGFGGSTMAQCLHFTDRIVIPYKPKTIVLREGTNDLQYPKVTVQEVADQYAQFIKQVQTALPETRIIILSVNPTPGRAKNVARQQELNNLLKAMVTSGKNLDYVDLWAPTLGSDGKPRPELFATDGIHNSPEGYRLWTQLITPHLK
jgi:lysophospholipase L1-like esterase